MADKEKKKRVGVLMGGPSCERDISLRSGGAVCRALLNKGIDAVPVELVKSPMMNGYAGLVRHKIQSLHIDVAFIALHGTFGEDGTIQKILEGLKIPYTGSRVDASMLGMDKIRSKEVFKTNNIPIPRHRIISGRQEGTLKKLDKTAHAHVYFKELGTPLVIKPSNEGSSIGLSIVDNGHDFYTAISEAFRYSKYAIVEQYVKGREITVGILEDTALPVVEILPKKRFFDFEAKYERGLTEYMVPAEINKGHYEAIQGIALQAHKALGARYFSRVDMILSEGGIPLVLEVNTIPGLTETSLLPKATQACGIDFEQLALKILESAE